MDKTITITFLVAAAVAGICLSVASYEDNLPPHYVDICTHSHSKPHHYFMLVGKILIPATSTHDVCDKYEQRCEAGSKYVGPLQCN